MTEIIAIGDVFRLDADQNIISPAGGLVVERERQICPGIMLADVDLLNRVYRLGMLSAGIDTAADRARDRERIEAAKAWIEGPVGCSPILNATRVVGCACGWSVSEGEQNPDAAWALHASGEETP